MDKRDDRFRDQTRSPRKKPRPVKYFIPGQLVLHLEHPDGIKPEALLAETTAFLKNQKDSETWKKQVEPPKLASILTFPKREDREAAFSLVVVEAPSAKRNDEELVRLSNQLNSQAKEKPINVEGTINLRVASPNWLVGGAPAQSGTGGPGGWPTEASPPLQEEWMFQFANPERQDAWSSLASDKVQGDGVHVAILDTAPTLHDRDKAYQEWRWQHKLIERLLGPKTPLTVYAASHADLYDTLDYDLFGHRYLMRDHGLFVAGIIHTIAPKARLHLYEVLNPYGVGSLETIARGLIRALNEPAIQGHPLIINCSFMLGIPVKRNGRIDWDFDPLFPIEFRDDAILEQLRLSTQEVFDLLTTRRDTFVVAAAGNDGYYDNSSASSNHVRPDARYPAAFEKVLGVGALPSAVMPAAGQYMAASYSNLSDRPPKLSYITLGGEPGPKKGILGMYIGEFPVYEEPPGCLGLLFPAPKNQQQSGEIPTDAGSISPERIRYKPNSTGWAWWAGTSFATPIVSGILAANFGQQISLGTALGAGDADDTLNPMRQPVSTNQSENVILVRQA
jgi:subtilisin family serine protease